MVPLLQHIFDSHFMPHVLCLRSPDVIWLHVVSDALIAIAYAAIPFALVRLVRLRKDLSFHWIFALFAAFILSCGTTHLLAIVTLWIPVYRFEGLVKLFTAFASVGTAILVVRLVPEVASLPSLALGSMRQLADSMPQIVWASTPDGSMDYYNQRWGDYTGLKPSQAKAWGWQQCVHPDDLAGSAEKWRQSLTNCHPLELEFRLKRKLDGAYRWHLSRALPIRDQSGEVVRWFGTCTDIEDYKQAEAEIKSLNENLEKRVQERTAELRRAEGRFRDLLESAPDAMVVVTADSSIALVNAQAERLFRYSRAELLSRHISILVPDHLMDAQSAPRELLARRKDGSEFPVEISQSPLETAEGTLVSNAIRDITERKRAEDHILALNGRLKEAASDAEAANRAKSTFLSTMSHEIRTPLNAILGYAQLMLRDPQLNDDAKTNLRIIGRSGEHLLGLINDVLDMSKIEAGRSELHPVLFNVPRLLEDLTAMFRLRAESKGLRFELRFDDETTPYVVADEGRVRQALINLLGNAVRFTHEGFIRLHVTLQAKNGDGDSLWFSASVEDTGTGISEEEQRHLFQPFSQVHVGQSRVSQNTGEGTGLGLAISRKYAQMMGGDITLKSRRGEGSTFCFEIPVQRGDLSVAVRGNSERRVIGVQAGVEAPEILVVDDQPENRDSLMKLLACVGFPVRGAENGEEAIECWRQRRQKLILMDVHMPVMNGLEATRRIKADPMGSDTRIIVLSASAMDDDRRKIADTGADCFLAKPCREDRLFESLGALLKVSFDYEESGHGHHLAGIRAESLTGEDLRRLPPELLQELQQATFTGNKRLLDSLVLKVRAQAPGSLGDSLGSVADSLKELADRYEYDKLTRLLEEACPRTTS
jgi:PAS domain S-box-containing protein